MSNLPASTDSRIKRLFDAFVAAMVFPNGTSPSDPPSFRDTRQNPIVLPSEEFQIEVRGLPGGQNLMTKIRPHNAPVGAFEGVVDLTALFNELAEGAGLTTGTATLVASTVTVTIATLDDGTIPVPEGSTVWATVTTAAGNVKQLTAVRATNNTITISSPGSGYASLLEAAGVSGTLVAGVKDLTLANVVGDRLSVFLTTSGGTPGTLSVKRKSATEVTVESWEADGVQEDDTSVVTAYNFGQAAHETSLVRWAVVRPS